MTSPPPARATAVRRYLQAPDLSAREAAARLARLHAYAVAGQVAAAGAVAAGLVAFAGRPDTPSGLMAATLLAGSYLHLAIGVAAGVGGTQAAARTARRWRDAAHRPADGEADRSAPNDPGATDPGATDEGEPDRGATDEDEPDRGATDEGDPDRAAPTLATVRRAGLSTTLLAGILLAAPAWFLAFAWATGQTTGTLLGTGGALALGYALGLVQARRTARAVTPRPPDDAPAGDEGAGG